MVEYGTILVCKRGTGRYGNGSCTELKRLLYDGSWTGRGPGTGRKGSRGVSASRNVGGRQQLFRESVRDSGDEHELKDGEDGGG